MGGIFGDGLRRGLRCVEKQGMTIIGILVLNESQILCCAFRVFGVPYVEQTIVVDGDFWKDDSR